MLYAGGKFIPVFVGFFSALSTSEDIFSELADDVDDKLDLDTFREDGISKLKEEARLQSEAEFGVDVDILSISWLDSNLSLLSDSERTERGQDSVLCICCSAFAVDVGGGLGIDNTGKESLSLWL